MELSSAISRLQELEKTTRRLANENEALFRCLQNVGVLQAGSLAVELHRLGFERMRCRHPLGSTVSVLDAVTPHAFVAIAGFAGSGPSKEFSMAAPALSTTRQEASALLPARQRIYAVGGFNEKRGGRLRVVERYNPEDDRWSTSKALPAARDGLGAVALGTRLYAIGGSNSHYEAIDTVERYDPQHGVWEFAAPLAVARRALAVVELDGRAYALGGHDDTETLNLAERYDPQTRAWETVAPMRCSRWYLAAVAHQGKLYAVGGADEDLSPLSTVERYDEARDIWETVAEMPTARGALATVMLGDKLYALGGGALDGPLAIVERYDPAKNVWEKAADMPTARCGISAAVADGCIYVMGGNADGFISVADDQKLDLVERYDPRNDRWEQVANMPTARSHLAAVTVHGRYP